MSTEKIATKYRSPGFSLMELMITLVIIAILAAIAYPSYQSYMVRNNRAAAQSALMDIAQRQQQYLLDSRAYAPDVATLNVVVPANATSNYAFAIALTAGPPPTFTATATPIAGTRQVADGALTIDNTGAKTPTTKW